MVVCVHIPRFELVVAVGDRPSIIAHQALAGQALALAPLAGEQAAAGQRVGEVSGAAEACGVTRGMLLGEALARCPELRLVPADPVRVGETWETLVCSLESIGAAVEPAGPGLAHFETDGLEGIHGGRDGVLDAAARALGRSLRIGGGPTRFCALAAALAVRSSRPLLLARPDARRWLAAQPIGMLRFRDETAALVEPLQRLGVRTLGELAALGRGALSDRFGRAGERAHGLACVEDAPLRPRRPRESLGESMEVGDVSSGVALQRVLGVLVGRLLARGERRGRTLRAVTISARLVAGGGWRERVVFREALGDHERIRLALSGRLALLPAPASSLRLAVDSFGPATGEQGTLLDQGRADRAAGLGRAVAQVRALAGADAALRAVCVDPLSRVPERRAVLAPIPE